MPMKVLARRASSSLLPLHSDDFVDGRFIPEGDVDPPLGGAAGLAGLDVRSRGCTGRRLKMPRAHFREN
jgi:hypothetical protein